MQVRNWLQKKEPEIKGAEFCVSHISFLSEMYGRLDAKIYLGQQPGVACNCITASFSVKL